jgi:DNA-binding transcriptional ArsR family regulator
MKILAALSEGEASPKDLAAELGESIGVVSYHVRQLFDLKCLELVREEPRRGAVEHYYRAIERPYFTDADWAHLPAPVKRSISQGTLSEIWRDVGQALDSETFDSRDDRHLSWTNLTLDEQAWRELNEILGNVIEDALAMQAESLERLESGESAPATSKLVLMHFHSAPKPKAKRESGRKSKPRRKAK